MHVCVYACMHVCLYACIHVCVYAGLCECLKASCQWILLTFPSLRFYVEPIERLRKNNRAPYVTYNVT